MEFNKVELLEVAIAETDADVAVRELAELELALVGGGHGEVII